MHHQQASGGMEYITMTSSKNNFQYDGIFMSIQIVESENKSLSMVIEYQIIKNVLI